jgi:excisionase family DNA binding protein
MPKRRTTRRLAPVLDNADPNACFTIDEAAAIMAVTSWTIRHLINDGELRAIKVRRLLRIRAEDLRSYLTGVPSSTTPLRALRQARTG